MDSLLLDSSISGIENGYYISCYYVVDNHLRYISLCDANLFYLHYADSDCVGQKIKQSSNEHDFDAYVYNQNKPIFSMCSNYENIDNKNIRIVSIKTSTGNPITRKPKTPENINILTRYSNNNKKLF